MPPKKRANGGEAKSQSKKRKKNKTTGDSDDSDLDGEGNFGGNGQAENNDDIGEEETVDITLDAPLSTGELVICGGTNWDLIGRSKVPAGVKNRGGPNLWGPHRVKGLTGVKIRSVVTGPTACHCIVITNEGKVLSWGRNEKGQLGHGDTERRDLPTKVEFLDPFNIIDAACGKNHTLFLTDKGKVFSCGENKFGQLGLGHQNPTVTLPSKVHCKGPAIRKVACGGDFSMISDIRGNLFSFGCPEYGQLGHNSDGKYFVTSNKLSFRCELVPRKVNVFIEKSREGHVLPVTDVVVRDIACGCNHTIVRDSKSRAYTWGFGGYGRLGHAGPKDEMVPRLLKFFDGPNRGAGQVFAGSQFTLAISEVGALYLWGQNKTSGEAAMYPKLVHDLTGWKVRNVSGGFRSIMVVADESVISWGPSPTMGELGYGDSKARSSTTPQEAKPLDGVYIHNISLGYAFSLILARADSDEEKERLEKLPIFTP
ncbi:protein RCC2 [Patella vulgata]|uniref:protein RCC2 n=1 Tax=Patella vulgata TaxID=6465 RepID=UPI00217FCEBD|nr:protein RCC2 [Patella vulgata]